MAEIKDFTRPHLEPRQFRIDDDVFDCVAEMPAGVVKIFSKMFASTPIDQYDQLGQMLDLFLLPTSAERFAERMMSQTEPITMAHINMIVEWLMEEFSGRPTRPAKRSSPSARSTGTNSMDGAQVEAALLST